MQINEINWLHNKKSDLLKEIIELELKSQKIFHEHDFQIQNLEKQLKQKQEILQQSKRASESSLIVLERKIEQFSSIILKKEKQIQKSSHQNQILQKSNKSFSVELQALQDKLSLKQVQFQKVVQLSQAKLSQQQCLFNRQIEKEKQKLKEVIIKYDNLLIDKEMFYKTKYEKEISQMRQQTDNLIRQLEDKYSSKQFTEKQDSKKIQKEYTKLFQDQKNMFEELNSCKSKLLSVQSNLTTERQQAKLKQKQFELKLQNTKKQLELIREAQQRLTLKNKIYLQKNQELTWQLKQLEIKFAQDSKKIKKTAQRQIAQLIDRSEKQNLDLKNQLSLLKNNELAMLIQQNNILKRSNQIIQNEKVQLQKHLHDRHTEIKKINEEFAQILKVTKQNQDLKQINFKRLQQIQVLEQEIKRLKQKCNKLTSVYQEIIKNKEIMERENKMLLEEIIFLRDKNKKNREKHRNRSQLEQTSQNVENKNKSQSILEQSGNALEMKSEISQNIDDVNSYKEVIAELDKEMQEALVKINQKDKTIQKQQSMIVKMQRIIAYGK